MQKMQARYFIDDAFFNFPKKSNAKNASKKFYCRRIFQLPQNQNAISNFPKKSKAKK